ncbi:D-threonine aldolase [Candidatus Filomicrobium marinum]|uniref:D-threonine aldolase n=2 Tax=Filomicrobium TaxID=119044 RepID=A0A0D6JKM4_9HYPH|nr:MULTISPECIES: DSD1 family PLP-dependent enzyme [Filomicrobium]MCV0371336.1 DSD1 family PLP-dependent enzyme [Filomicrobium sp.]CFX56626.1 D-threonine aldolase [Candidatus Filomicrobium marinum]CPR22247.1 D-threonine aldolase [Candidatus Filomicrobium marinum]SDO90939.1 D-serine deaminase, pyridoxal phosphate-dependent [Filomicrobium insigne]
MRAPARLGIPLADVDTPALILDLDAFERNLQTMADWAKSKNVRLRPHAKSHKCPAIAHRQMALGAVGVCCQKVSEAEVMVDAGITNVLISNEVVGRTKLEALAQLALRARMGVCVDDIRQIRDLSEAMHAAGATIDVLVEINIGGNRCGVEPGDPAVRLGAAVAQADGLRFAGLQSYDGITQHVRDPDERKARAARAGDVTAQTIAALRDIGLECETVGGAGTGSFAFDGMSGVWNELQPGSYAFMDADYARNTPAGGDVPKFEHAMFVWAIVMSRTSVGQAVVDAGHKVLPIDSGMPVPFDRPGVRYERPSDEHGCLVAELDSALPDLGEKILIVPSHVDPTANQHDFFIGVRGMAEGDGTVQEIWPVTARGCVF